MEPTVSDDRKSNIVRGSYINTDKKLRSRQLRSEQTPAEEHLWRLIRKNKLDGFHFRRQQVIDGFIVDFYCHKAGLVVELDGKIHLNQKKYDRERENVLKNRGLTVTRFTNEDVLENTSTVLQAICKECRRLMDHSSET